jgi:tetratricopeptide (TPR) repeat protein
VKGSAEAEAALSARDFAQARRPALALVELDPASPEGYRFLARVAEGDGNLEDAWTAASKAHALDPADDRWSMVTANLAMKTGRFAEAVALYTAVARRDPAAAPFLDEARFQFQAHPGGRAALSPGDAGAARGPRLVARPEIREARVTPSPEVAVDAVIGPTARRSSCHHSGS